MGGAGNDCGKWVGLAVKVDIYTYSLSKLSWRDRKRGRKGIHLTENGSNKRHVILMGVNARAHYQVPV